MNAAGLKSFLAAQVSKLEQVYPYASAFAAESNSKYAHYGTYERSAGNGGEKKGVTLTVFTGHYFKERSVDSLEFSDIEKLTAGLISDRTNDIKYEQEEAIVDPGEIITADYVVKSEIPVSAVDLAQLLSEGERVGKLIQEKDARIVNAGVTFNYEELTELFVNRNKKLSQKITRGTGVCFLALKDGELSSQIWGGESKLGGAEHLTIDMAKMDKIVSDGLKLLYAKRLEPGTYDCVFSPAMAGMFAHEAFGHGMETDMFLKKRAKGAEYLGKPVASAMVDMFDGPLLPNEAGSYFFDNEGEIAATTQIIDKGLLVSGLTDLNSALKLKMKRTPNGRREDYSHKVYARMTNTYFGKGSSTVEEMISSIKSGYFVDYATNGMEDPKGWGIQLEALMAREIKDGKLTDNYFSPVIVTGYVPELLMSISMVGKEFEIHGLGQCGKGHKEWVKVSDGGPALKLKARLA
jgi:TldD protein